MDKTLDEKILNEMIEHDIVVRMPPKRQYIVELKIKSIEKAIPKIFEPEENQWK